jgi:hypothetical protein
MLSEKIEQENRQVKSEHYGDPYRANREEAPSTYSMKT